MPKNVVQHTGIMRFLDFCIDVAKCVPSAKHIQYPNQALVKFMGLRRCYMTLCNAHTNVERSAFNSGTHRGSELLLKHTGTVQRKLIVFQLRPYFQQLLILTSEVLLLLTAS